MLIIIEGLSDGCSLHEILSFLVSEQGQVIIVVDVMSCLECSLATQGVSDLS
jgi:hypothetical protein